MAKKQPSKKKELVIDEQEPNDLGPETESDGDESVPDFGEEIDPDLLEHIDDDLDGIDEYMDDEKVVVGGEIDAFCFHCKRVTLHTVVSMLRGRPAKVLCNACEGQHQFHASGPESGGREGGRTKQAPRSRAIWEDALSKADASHVQPYRPTHCFQPEDVMEHPHFGKGVVVRVYDLTKMEVLFEDQVRRLVHNRPAAN